MEIEQGIWVKFNCSKIIRGNVMNKKLLVVAVIFCFFILGCHNNDKRAGEPLAESERLAQTDYMQMSGKVKAVSVLPKFGSAPYKECITALWVIGIRSGEQELADQKDGVLVYMISMKDGKANSNADIKVGDVVTINVISWKEAEEDYGSYKRIEIDDPDSYALDTYFKVD